MEPGLFDAIRSEAAPLLAATPAERRVVVWGAGELGHWLMEALGERGVAFVDANPAKHGREIVRRPVHPVEELGTLACDEVWVAVLSDVQAIRDRLRARGLAEGRDFHVPFAKGKEKQVQDALPRMLDFLGCVDVAGREVLEVGFGGQLFLAATLVHRGAARVLVSDVEPQTAALEAPERRAEWLAFLRHLARAHGPAPAAPEALLERIAVHPAGVSASRPPFERASFDLVASTGVLEHVDDPRAAIEGFARVLRPGGLALALAVGIHDHRANDPRAPFTPWSFLSVSDEAWGSPAANAYHQNRWRAVDFERCFVEHGFDLVRVDKTADPRLGPDEARRFDPRFRDGYSLRELSELDLWLAARRPC